MTFFDLVPSPIGNKELFIFNVEFLTSRSGHPFLRFDLGVSENGCNIMVRQMRLSGGVIRPPQVRVGRKKIDQALFGAHLSLRIAHLVRYYVESMGFPLEIKSDKMMTSRMKMRENKLRNPFQLGEEEE